MDQDNSSTTLTPATSDAGKRLDAFLAERVEKWSRSKLQKLIDDECVLVNGSAARPSYKLRPGDEIDVELTEPESNTFAPEEIPLDIVYEDEYLAVINKPAGMVVHPGAGVHSGTLANAIAYHFERQKPAREPISRDVENYALTHVRASANMRASAADYRVGIVHRLDKDTSGLIVVAKNDQTHEALATQFRERNVFKSYVALVHGATEQNSGTIDAPIARNKHNRLRMRVATQGRSSLSLWKVRKRYEKFTLLDVEIKTGRTHQIRVHMGYINHPVVGDAVYNEGRDNTIANAEIRQAVRTLGRFFLHAERLSFTHPETQERLEFTQPLPFVLNEFLDLL